MLANLRALLGVVADIVLLRRGPEHLPASPVLLAFVVVAYVVLYALAYQVFVVPQLPQPPPAWPLQSASATLLELLWFRVAFNLVRKGERFVQTATALFAVNTLFIFCVPLLAALIPASLDPQNVQPPLLPLLLGSFAGIWMLVVLVRIVRGAFEWGWVASALLLLGGLFVPAVIVSAMFSGSPNT
jgi:hypothetical protein